MEPVTHFLTGACIGRAGLNRRTAYATLAATLAARSGRPRHFLDPARPGRRAEAPSRHHPYAHRRTGRGRRSGRGSLAASSRVGRAAKTQASRRAPCPNQAHPPPPPPSRSAGSGSTSQHLSLLSAISCSIGPTPTASVLFSRLTPRWYAGNLVFIAEPVLWALLLPAVIMPWLLGLADREMGARRTAFRGRGWAIFALAGMVSALVLALG